MLISIRWLIKRRRAKGGIKWSGIRLRDGSRRNNRLLWDMLVKNGRYGSILLINCQKRLWLINCWRRLWLRLQLFHIYNCIIWFIPYMYMYMYRA